MEGDFMDKMEIAIKRLKEANFQAFEQAGILVIPCEGPEVLEETVSYVKSILKEIGYDKSWRVDPYFFDEKALEREMYHEYV